MSKIYVASSWRNGYYPAVVEALRSAGHEVYDFRNPPHGGAGFHWTDVDPEAPHWTFGQYAEGLDHPLAKRQFAADLEALEWADTCVLVLPCGRSAHTEAGWMAGAGKRVIAYIPEMVEPELMYKLFDRVVGDLDELVHCLEGPAAPAPAPADITHYFIEKGSGEPLILLHGNGESGEYFAGQIDEFARHWHVLAPDTRGHGKTPRGTAPFTISQFADDLRRFMDARGIAKAHILGFSDGGNIAMVFALRYPERVDRLILDGANLDARGVRPSIQIPIELGYRCAKLFARRSEEARLHAEMLGLMVNDPALRPEELSAIRAETLVMAGTRDMIKEGHTRLIAASIPHARLVFIEGDHFIAAKCPEAFNRAVTDFLLQS